MHLGYELYVVTSDNVSHNKYMYTTERQSSVSLCGASLQITRTLVAAVGWSAGTGYVYTKSGQNHVINVGREEGVAWGIDCPPYKVTKQ